MTKKKEPELILHNILADGREVGSLEGFEVRLEQVPGLMAILEKRIRDCEANQSNNRNYVMQSKEIVI
ncbi:MAG: hypothetical protein Q4G33_14515 [bacterium]|nr:hypothetical protein [bacterium]